MRGNECDYSTYFSFSTLLSNARAQRTNNHYWLDIRIEQTFYGYTNASKPIKNYHSYDDN